MIVFTAPEPVFRRGSGEVLCFLAGGITGCPDWQKEVIDKLYSIEDSGVDLSKLVILNPRRENFDVSDQSSAYIQIEWEFNHLASCDIFSIYFCGVESVQPICLYELGRNLVTMQRRFPETFDSRVLVSVEDGYSRSFDVIAQTNLAMLEPEFHRRPIIFHKTASPEKHAKAIVKMYRRIKETEKVKNGTD